MRHFLSQERAVPPYSCQDRLAQDFSASALLTIPCWQGGAALCAAGGAEQHLWPLKRNARASPPPAVTAKILNYSQVPPGGQSHPRLRATGQGSFTHRLIKKKKIAC